MRLPPLREIIGRILLGSVIFFLTSCFYSELLNQPIDQAHFKLASLSQRRIALEAKTELNSGDGLGTQFVFFVLPAGRFSMPEPELFLERRAYETLSELGYRPITGKGWSEREPRKLVVTLRDLSVSGFDMFFARRLVCGVDLQGELRDGEGAVIASFGADERSSKLRKSAFAKDLDPLITETLDAALKKLFRGLKL